MWQIVFSEDNHNTISLKDNLDTTFIKKWNQGNLPLSVSKLSTMARSYKVIQFANDSLGTIILEIYPLYYENAQGLTYMESPCVAILC